MINSKNVYTLSELQAEAAKDGFYLEFDFRPTTDLSGESVRGTFAARFVPMGYKEKPTRNVTRHVCGAMGFNPMLGDTCPKCEELLDTTLRSVDDTMAFANSLSKEDEDALARIAEQLKDVAAPEGEYEQFLAEQAFDKSMKDVL